MIENCLNSIPKDCKDLYDLGAKYASMRKTIEAMRPDITYHGVRSRESRFDVNYISAHDPHKDDIIVEAYDDFYKTIPDLSPTSHLMFIDSAYYVSEE